MNNLFEVRFFVNNQNQLGMDILWSEQDIISDRFEFHGELEASIAILLFSISNGSFNDNIKQILLEKAKDDRFLAFIKAIYQELQTIAQDKISSLNTKPIVESTDVLSGMLPL